MNKEQEKWDKEYQERVDALDTNNEDELIDIVEDQYYEKMNELREEAEKNLEQREIDEANSFVFRKQFVAKYRDAFGFYIRKDYSYIKDIFPEDWIEEDPQFIKFFKFGMGEIVKGMTKNWLGWDCNIDAPRDMVFITILKVLTEDGDFPLDVYKEWKNEIKYEPLEFPIPYDSSFDDEDE